MSPNQTNPDEGFGDPKHDEGFKSFPQNLKDGDQDHRILPPLHTCIETGAYHRGWAVHYGAEKKVGDKTIALPFLCVEEIDWVDGEKVITRKCPACEQIKVAKNKEASDTTRLKEVGKADKEIAEELRGIRAWVKKHNRSFREYVNVKTSDGRYKTYSYPSKEVWKKIKEFIDKYSKLPRPIDAVRANQGLWFRITRSGKGQYNTEYAVEVAMEEVNSEGQTFYRPKLAPLTSEDYGKAKAGCMDLNDLGFKVLTVEQVSELVKSNYDSAAVKRLWVQSKNVEAENVPADTASIDNAANEERIKRQVAAEEAMKKANAEREANAVVAPDPAVVAAQLIADAQKKAAEILAKAQAAIPEKALPAPKQETKPTEAPAKTTPTSSPSVPAATSAEEEAFLRGLKDFSG